MQSLTIHSVPGVSDAALQLGFLCFLCDLGVSEQPLVHCSLLCRDWQDFPAWWQRLVSHYGLGLCSRWRLHHITGNAFFGMSGVRLALLSNVLDVQG